MTTAQSEPTAAATRYPRRSLRWLGTVFMALAFTAGIIYMMMSLAGRFVPKVQPDSAGAAAGPCSPTCKPWR